MSTAQTFTVILHPRGFASPLDDREIPGQTPAQVRAYERSYAGSGMSVLVREDPNPGTRR